MMSLKYFAFLFLSVFSFSAWSLSFDWSGWSRVEAYYQHTPKQNYYSSYHFVLEPDIQVIDGLNVTSRLELSALNEKSLFSSSEFERQTGIVFIYGEDSEQKELESTSLFLRFSQIYIDYQSEFFKVRLGRAPYHFGMGLSYSASQNPFQHWISTYNQAALYLKYSQFYLQPVLLYKGDSFLAIAQAGLLNENWKLEAFYRYDFEDNSFTEFFAQYDHSRWQLKASASYEFGEGDNVLWALEALTTIPAKVPFQLEIKTGGALGDLSFHPNYDVALLYWNRFISPTTASETNTFNIAEGRVQKGIYFSPRVLFSFMNDQFKFRPAVLVARDLESEKFNYELDLEGMYQLDESFFFSLKGGALYLEKEFHLALLAQAAVSF